MAESISLTQQIEDLDFYKAILQERNVTEQFQLDEYRMDVEDRIADASIKKQAIEVLNQLESQLEENEKLQAEEDVVEPEEEDDENTVRMSFLEPEDDEITSMLGDEPDLSGSPQPEDVVEMPKFEMTEEERAAMNQLAAFNQEQRLDTIESSVVSTPNEATLVAKQGLNTAKAGLQNAKSYVQGKIENMDADKMDEAWQSTFKGLKVAYDLAVKGIVAFYKIPAKRHYKKKLDYTIAETVGKDLKGMLDVQKAEMKHHFLVDWLPKLILLLSAFLIYNNFWKMGGIALGIGFVYYMITYANFDYGGSRMLNMLAAVMDGEGIRLKDAYYNNMLVLYNHFNEFQSAFGVTIDEKAKIDMEVDENLGLILTFFIKEDKNVSITSITDHRMNYYKLLPYLDTYNHTAKLQNGRKVMVMFDQILLQKIEKEENLTELLASKEEYWDFFPELKGLSEARRLEAEALLEQEADNKFYADIAQKKLSEKAVSIIKFLRQDKENLGMSPHDLHNSGIKGNNDFLKVRMHLNQGTTLAQAKSKLAYIGSKTGITPKVIEITTTSSAIFLMFYLNISLKSREMTMEDIKEEGRKGIFTLGKGYLGDYTTKIPREDSPFFPLVGGLSRSGKSTLATRLLANTSYLQDENGFYDYEDYFISSVKDEDYTANGFKQSGMYVTGSPIETYNMLVLVDKIASERKNVFLNNDVINIKQYNKKFSTNKMGKIMVVMDEYANLFRACGNQKIETAGGKVKLKDAIEQKLVKINAEHGSRGVSSIVITQNFMKDEVGAVRDTIECKILGNAESNVWSSYDNTGTIGKIMQKKSEEVQGVFLMSSKAFQPLEGVEVDSVNGFVETKTHFIDTDAIRAGFDRTYETAAKYTDIIANAELESEDAEPEVTTYNLNDDVEIAEDEESFQL